MGITSTLFLSPNLTKPNVSLSPSKIYAHYQQPSLSLSTISLFYFFHYLSLYLSIYLSIYLSVSLSFPLFLYVSFCFLSLSLSPRSIFIYLSIHTHIYTYMYFSLFLLLWIAYQFSDGMSLVLVAYSAFLLHSSNQPRRTHFSKFTKSLIIISNSQYYILCLKIYTVKILEISASACSSSVGETR